MAQRTGPLNTMVFTHLPANVCLVLAALAPSLPVALGLLMIRSSLSSMDVPTRTAYVMAVVTPAERSAAASFTAVPRSLAAAIGLTLSGALFAAGWISLPFIACGLLKITYDLTLWRAMGPDQLDGEQARQSGVACAGQKTSCPVRIWHAATERSTMAGMKHLPYDSHADHSAVRSALRQLERGAASVLLAVGAAALIGWLIVELYVKAVTAD